MLASVWIKIERSSVGDIGAGFIRNHGDVIADLALVRPAFLRIERSAYRHIRRPGDTGVGTVGVEKL